jgi:hypothetical protein
MRFLVATLMAPAFLLTGLASETASAQPSANPLEANRPLPPGPPRWQENYRFLKDPGKRNDRFDNLRYHDLGDSAWLQLGGELRYGFITNERPNFDLTPARTDSFIQQRAQFHASLHLFDNSLRTFVQLQNTRSWNQAMPTPRDESRTDIAQAFIDANFNLGDVSTTARIGRQELVYGNGALINIGELRNIRLAFDGARFMFNGKDGKRLDVLAVRPVQYDLDNFDDGSDNNVRLFGLYGSLPLKPGIGVDLYGFSRELKERNFQGFIGEEDRHTLGARLFGKTSRLDWSWDLMHQSGEHAGRDIRAWGIRSDTGYSFQSPARVRLGLHLDVASGGDPRSASTTRTFDPLYPRNGTYGEAGVTTMANLVLVGPSFGFSPTATTRIQSSIMQTWRESTDDFVYLPNMRPLAATLGNTERDIGTIYQVTGTWQPNRNLNVELHLMSLDAGSAITQAGGKDVHSVFLRTAVRF